MLTGGNYQVSCGENLLLDNLRMEKPQQNSPEIEEWLKLIRANGVGPVTFAKLLEHFGTIDKVLGASVSAMTKVEGIGLKTAEEIAATHNKFDAIAELEAAEKLGVWIIHFNDERYPPVLRRIYDPPPVLYIKGSLSKQDNLSVAIVGCRRCSLYGQEQASRFGHLLASAGFTVCSGMARGIDTAAHQGALSAGGRTIAVQGCGLANIFPPENAKLFELIAESGACVSELPLQYEPLSENFPPRNRIIAGLSLGTIVIEAGLKSGALITARAALENNREVMAIPGKIDSPISKGTHQLLKQGAKLVESIEDVMESLGYVGEQLREYAKKSAAEESEAVELPLLDASQLNLSASERLIYDYLEKEAVHIDQITAETDLMPAAVSAGLVSLQLKGLVKQLPGSLFIKR